jgi:hypothetical protein
MVRRPKNLPVSERLSGSRAEADAVRIGMWQRRWIITEHGAICLQEATCEFDFSDESNYWAERKWPAADADARWREIWSKFNRSPDSWYVFSTDLLERALIVKVNPVRSVL